MRLMTRYLIPALAACVLLPALDADAQRRERDRDDHERRWEARESVSRLDTTVALARDGTVELDAGHGEIAVTGWDRAEVKIRAVSESGALRLDATPSRVALSTQQGYGHRDVRFEVTVPQGARVIASGRDDVEISGTRGDVEVRTMHGDVRIREALRTAVSALSSDVSLTDVGQVRLNLTSGDIRMSGVNGDIEVNAVSGDIEMERVTANYVRTTTTSGTVAYQGTIARTGRYEFTSHSGDVIVHLPADVAASVSLQTYSGEIESDFPITLEGGATIGGHPRNFEFRLGGGGARLTVQSFSGTVQLRRAGTQNR